MTEAGRRLISAAHEALSIAKGTAAKGTYRVHKPPAKVDVKAIRKSMGLTQAAFGEQFGFGASRIRDWEQERTRPAASDRVLLCTIAASPNTVMRALKAADAGIINARDYAPETTQSADVKRPARRSSKRVSADSRA